MGNPLSLLMVDFSMKHFEKDRLRNTNHTNQNTGTLIVWTHVSEIFGAS